MYEIPILIKKGLYVWLTPQDNYSTEIKKRQISLSLIL